MVRMLVEKPGRNNPSWGVPTFDCGAVVTTFDEDGRDISSYRFWPK